MKPPWEQYPDQERSDLGWRMGAGEDYLVEFERWFSAQTPDQRVQFAGSHAEPESWIGYYTGWDVPMAPPWRRYPELGNTSWEWREVHAPRVYWMTFHDWLLRLTPQAMTLYASSHPEPDNWSGFYSSIGIETE
ncbi:MAG: hypothetical protein K2X34_11760 [Hyphomonadaceae bacterium]|nr:hypothetical protein [Hyphomonadaceae bacterium]